MPSTVYLQQDISLELIPLLRTETASEFELLPGVLSLLEYQPGGGYGTLPLTTEGNANFPLEFSKNKDVSPT